MLREKELRLKKRSVKIVEVNHMRKGDVSCSPALPLAIFSLILPLNSVGSWPTYLGGRGCGYVYIERVSE
jgi:hypothetical protein